MSFEILIPELSEWSWLNDETDPWQEFISVEDALQVVEQTTGLFGPLPISLIEEIAMDEMRTIRAYSHPPIR